MHQDADQQTGHEPTQMHEVVHPWSEANHLMREAIKYVVHMMREVIKDVVHLMRDAIKE